MVLDLVDSVGERRVGQFLQARSESEDGFKLLNVAMSRAKETLIFVANLTYLNDNLPGDAVLRGILHEVQRVGSIIDVRDVLVLHPILPDLRELTQRVQLDPAALQNGIFRGQDFSNLSRLDIESAQRSIVIFSGFITQERVAQLADLLRAKISNGVGVRCVTRPPRRNGSIPESNGRAALRALESIGVAIDLRNEIHEKVVLVDERIAWLGSLNPLSHTDRTSELMVRVSDEAIAEQVAKLLSVCRTSGRAAANFSVACAENPRCDNCGSWTVYILGRYGPFFGCESDGCSWKIDLNRVSQARRSSS
jgi:hypothetical protein